MCRGLEVDPKASISTDWKKRGSACFGGREGGEGLSCVQSGCISGRLALTRFLFQERGSGTARGNGMGRAWQGAARRLLHKFRRKRPGSGAGRW